MMAWRKCRNCGVWHKSNEGGGVLRPMPPAGTERMDDTDGENEKGQMVAIAEDL